MTHTPDRHLDVLRSHPCLTGFAGRGWVLDRLPVTSTALAFAATALMAAVLFQAEGVLAVLATGAVALLLSASAIKLRDVAAARAVLRLARAVLLGGLLVGACMLWVPGILPAGIL